MPSSAAYTAAANAVAAEERHLSHLDLLQAAGKAGMAPTTTEADLLCSTKTASTLLLLIRVKAGRLRIRMLAAGTLPLCLLRQLIIKLGRRLLLCIIRGVIVCGMLR